MGMGNDRLYQLLSELDYVPADDLKRAVSVAQSEQLPLYDALLKLDLISDENLGKLIAYSLKLPFVSIGQSSVPDDALRITPSDIVVAFRTVTFGLGEDNILSIATNDPDRTELFAMLAKKAGAKSYKIFFATERDIQDSLRLYKKDLSVALEALHTPVAGQASSLSVSSAVDTIIEYAYSNKASDVHIEPGKSSSLVRFRIDGVLHDMVRLPKTLHNQLVARVKILSRLRTDEHFSAQDGRMRVNLPNEAIDVRVSVVPIIPGEKIVMRLLASHFRQFSLTDLGMQPADLEKVKGGFMRPYGMVLSTGPTGSGKTTSMYAILKIINTRDKNIATIEDPVEYEIDGINQIQVNPKTNLTFANGLRSILRQDPDTMYVGEIRDEETADIAINSALTGHLVLSTLHTNNAATALPRLIDMKIEPFLVASTVNVIIAQRLVRKICNRCKVSVELTKGKTGWEGDSKIAAQLAGVNQTALTKIFGSGSIRVYQGKGCSVCHQTGYIGRIGIFEVLEVTPTIQSLISKKADSETIERQAFAEGMSSMMDDGLRKLQSGITSVEEILRVTRE